MITLSENFRALFYAPFYAAQATGAYAQQGVEVDFRLSSDPDGTAAALRSGEVAVMFASSRVITRSNANCGRDSCKVRAASWRRGRMLWTRLRLAKMSDVLAT